VLLRRRPDRRLRREDLHPARDRTHIANASTSRGLMLPIGIVESSLAST